MGGGGSYTAAGLGWGGWGVLVAGVGCWWKGNVVVVSESWGLAGSEWVGNE